MKEREELRDGKAVTVVEREPHEQTPKERQAAQDVRIAALEVDMAQLKQQVQQPLKPPK